VPDRSKAPLIHDAVTFDYQLPPLQKNLFPNGQSLYWLRAGVLEVLSIDWVMPAGIWQEPKQGVAQATAALLKSGTTSRTAEQINESFEFYGANLQVSCNNDWATVSLYCLRKHLTKLLPVVKDILENAVFPEKELMLYQQNALQKLLVSLRQCDFVANQKIDAVIFGSHHPYGRYSTKESIDAITQDDLLSFYQSHYATSPQHIFLSGYVTDVEISAIETYFGTTTLLSKKQEENQYEKMGHPDKKHFITNDPNGVQGAIRIGRSFINRQHPDFAPMVVLNTLLGGYFGSRLMSNIREDKGYTYGIYSSQIPFKNEGILYIQTEVGKEVIAPALQEIYAEMDKLCQEKVSDDELLLVKNYLLGNLLGDLDGPFHLMPRWRSLILNGFTEAHFNQNIAVYKTITPTEIQTLAQRYFVKDDFYEVVVV